MLEVFVFTACINAWGCNSTASAYYAYNKDLQHALKNAEKIVQEKFNATALTAANFALNYYTNKEFKFPIYSNTFFTYTSTYSNVQFGKSF